ncbi:hypothetical protein BDW68DRAFT_170373 [Aspergillus falconensis]
MEMEEELVHSVRCCNSCIKPESAPRNFMIWLLPSFWLTVAEIFCAGSVLGESLSKAFWSWAGFK